MRIAAFFCALCFSAFAFAEGDAAAGEKLYGQTCLACHGVGGASQIPANPILAGQHEEYLLRQLFYYRDNPKAAPAMAAMAKALSDSDIADLAAYLSSRPRAISGAADMELAKSGERLYRGGDARRALPACAACHGPSGGGIPPEYPVLSGQYAEYAAAALAAYASGERESPVMQPIAARLTKEEIQALAAYISGLAP